MIHRTFTLAEMPIYARESSIIAMRTDDFCETLHTAASASSVM